MCIYTSYYGFIPVGFIIRNKINLCLAFVLKVFKKDLQVKIFNFIFQSAEM